MLARIRAFLKKTSALKVAEHLAVAFASAFALAAIATAEHAAATHGFSLKWSFLAGATMTAATAGYQTIRPQLAAIGSRIVKKIASRAKA